jgi:hypothetical protein
MKSVQDHRAEISRLRAAVEQGAKLLQAALGPGWAVTPRPADETSECQHQWQYTSDTFKGEALNRICIVCKRYEDLRASDKTDEWCPHGKPVNAPCLACKRPTT